MNINKQPCNISHYGRQRMRIFQKGYGVMYYDRKTLEKVLQGNIPAERRDVLEQAYQMLLGDKKKG